jgi:hypothetical protein
VRVRERVLVCVCIMYDTSTHNLAHKTSRCNKCSGDFLGSVTVKVACTCKYVGQEGVGLEEEEDDDDDDDEKNHGKANFLIF